MASPGEIAPFFEGVSVCSDGPTTEPGASEGVRLREVSGGTLTGANLFKADLTKANLIQADLTEAFAGGPKRWANYQTASQKDGSRRHRAGAVR